MDRTLLLERLTTWLEADPRIQALWLGGSLGRYAGDAYSDIDLYVAVAEADFAPFYAQVPSLVAELRSGGNAGGRPLSSEVHA
jgi:predicted nucleotidyltransferase